MLRNAISCLWNSLSRKHANISAILLLEQMFIGLPFVEVNAWL
jgi:hypothetical protein